MPHLTMPSRALIAVSTLMAVFVFLVVLNGWLSLRLGLPLDDAKLWTWFTAPDLWRQVNPAAFAESLKFAGIGGAAALIGCLYLAATQPRQSEHANARWATRSDIRKAGLLGKTGCIVGKLGGPKSRAPFIRAGGDKFSNILLVAPPGVGKGVGIVIPTLLSWPGSAVVLDVKGENRDITAGRRHQMGDEVFVFSPYDPEGRTHRFNPLAPISKIEDADAQYTAISLLASHLLTSKGQADEPFINGARELFIAVSSIALESDTPTIGHVLRLLAPPLPSGDEDGGGMSKRFAVLAQQATHESARNTLLQYSAFDPRSIATFLSVLKSAGLGAWADPAIDRATSANDFDLTTLRLRPQTIYIVIAPNQMDMVAPVARLFFQSVTAAMQVHKPTAKEPYEVLLLLDEFNALGQMETIRNAATLLRGYGGRMLFVVQGVPDIEKVYGKAGAEGLMNSCQIHAYMSINDPGTKSMISRSLGTYQIITEQESRSRNPGKLGFSRTETKLVREARLLPEHAANRLGTNTILLLPQDAPPIKACKVRYFKDRLLAPLADLPWAFGEAEPEGSTNEGSTASDATEEKPSRPEPKTLAFAAAFIGRVQTYQREAA